MLNYLGLKRSFVADRHSIKNSFVIRNAKLVNKFFFVQKFKALTSKSVLWIIKLFLTANIMFVQHDMAIQSTGGLVFGLCVQS